MNALPVHPYVRDGVLRYAHQRIETGGFLRAVLENDLRAAVMAADQYNEVTLSAVVRFVFDNVPSIAWGSPERVRAWLARDDQQAAESGQEEEKS